MRRITKKTVAIAAGAIVLLGGAGSAYAYWTTSGGTGTGTGTTGTAAAVTVTQTSTVAGLAPGAAAQTLSGTFTNSTGAPVHVASVTASITVTPVDPAVCTTANYTLALNPMTNTADAGWDVAPGTVTTWTGATIQFNNTGANQDGCKGATVNLAYAVA